MILPAELSLKLRKSLINNEGYRNYPYVDSTGHLTIGIGYNLTDRGLDDDWINAQYQRDVEYFYIRLHEFPWFANLNLDRQIVLIDMAFMGWKSFLSFRKMLASLELGDYKNASREMLQSKWAIQVKGRAVLLAKAMETGVYSP